jgi:eukaryotic-like serine/threonine-protein kinase
MALLSGDPSQVEYLYARYLEVQPREGSAILDMLAAEPANRGRVLAKFQAELARNAGDGDSAAKRQANVAAALLRLNCPENVWPLFKHCPDPRVRSYLVERGGPLGVDAAILFRRLEEESDVSICRALVLALGEYEESQLPAAVALPRIKKLLEAKDAGLHGAAQWLLRKWNKEEPLLQMAPQEREQRLKEIVAEMIQNKQNAQARWYINSQGQAMVVIPPTGPFLMGSPPTEEGHNVLESPHHQRIARLFAICATPVTNQQFELYDPKHLHQERSQGRACPVVRVRWKEAAQYCNWLSEQENLARDQWCYETDKYGRVQRMKPNYLTLTGYRLPTEAEWEFACRAGAITSRAYGETAELLDDYGWYLRNSDARTWPVGTKKPNDLGLFDMHGNVWNWCQDSFHLYPPDQPGKVYDDKSDPVTDIGLQSRMLRGGSYLDAARDVRCADRSVKGPLEMLPHIGFRPARTLKAQ